MGAFPAPPRWSPTLRRRRLANTLADLRARDGRTAAEIAEALGWSESKVTRLEQPKHLLLPKPDEIRRLLEEYSATDEEHDQILTLVHQARARDWWHPYKQLLAPGTVTYLGLEAEASVIRAYEPTVIPTLLQTPAYAEALLRSRGMDEERASRLVEVHSLRLRWLFDGPSPLHLHILVGEAVLRQQVGGPDVLREQLDYLLAQGRRDNIVIQAVPFTATGLPAVRPFAVLTFMEPTDPEAVCTSSELGDHWLGDEAEQTRLEVAFEELVKVGASRTATRRLIKTLVGELAQEP